MFAQKDKYPPCGMFTFSHFILLCLGLLLFVVLVKRSKHWDERTVLSFTKATAILVILLEGTKIAFNFFNGYTWIDAWVPISFCSIFIYALQISAHGKGILKQMGDAYLSGSAFVAGLVFLLFPSTSLMNYPAWHYLCLYSIFFHVLMMAFNVIYVRNLKMTVDFHHYKLYLALVCFFVAISLMINTTWESNLMLIRQPFNIPFPRIQSLFENTPFLYTLFAVISYSVVPYAVTRLFINIKNKLPRNKKRTSSGPPRK